MGDYRAARLNTAEIWAYTLMPLMTIMTGLLVCAVLETITRQAYRSERVIAQQQQALMEERAQLSRFLAPEVTRMVRERGIEATLVPETLTLTAVCCDLRGFTRYTEQHGAAQMARVASTPSISGMMRSIRTMSGHRSWHLRSASRPS